MGTPMPLAVVAALLLAALVCSTGAAQTESPLPEGVKAVWDLDKAYRESTPTRERVCVNGLWRWQPADPGAEAAPEANWGFFKVPGCWPGITDYMQKDSQTVFVHPAWKDVKLPEISAAWHQREVTIPANWAGRRIALTAETVNSYAAVYVDGAKAGEILFPAGEADLTAVCRPGQKHVLSLLVVAMPLNAVMMSYNDTASAREVKGAVDRRGLCGDVWLTGTPLGPRVSDVRAMTSVRQGQMTLDVGLTDLAAEGRYALRGQVAEQGKVTHEFTGPAFSAADLKAGRISVVEKWRPGKLWDVHTPQNQCDLSLSLVDAGGQALDTLYPQRFGFRELWIEGKDFVLNGKRIYLSALPYDNAQVGAAQATYEGAKETMLRLQSFGINFVYTHNYGCEPGAHLGFTEILRAADDVGMLVALSQPHFGNYDWKAADADQSNGYARHAAFYTQVAGNHPSVVFYATSHNATGYSEDMNPDLIDGVSEPREAWGANNVKLALRAEAIISGSDPERIVYHHSSGNLSSMYTCNFYPNMVPIQEMSDWFEHWATKGEKPAFLCEYGAPFTWDFAMYRGWYRGGRTFGNAVVPWELCIAEWNAQFLGDRAYKIQEEEKADLRWEAERFRAGRLWYRWDYPGDLSSVKFDDRHEVMARYVTDNWRAHRTWGLSANSPWEYNHYWRLKPGVEQGRKELPVDWESLQRPGFSADYLDDRYRRFDIAFERDDWEATAEAKALMRNNMPLLAYIGGKAAAFTSKDHNFVAGETVEKQLIVINNSREPVGAECRWSLGLPKPVSATKTVPIPPGDQVRVPIRLALPEKLATGTYQLTATVKFSTGETQEDAFAVQVVPRVAPAKVAGKVALFDPRGETAALLKRLGVGTTSVTAETDLKPYSLLVIGKAALTVYGPAPDLSRVREGLKVIVFEQTAEALEKRLGLRVMEYGLRQVFPRVPDHPALAGLDAESLRDWRGEATIMPPRLKYEKSSEFNYHPTVKWCDITVPRLWRCGCRGNVASVLIEKPARGDFLPLVDGGYSLQYSPLLQYREGKGTVLLCQMDVTGRTESDPAAELLARNLLEYVSSWQPAAARTVVYAGEAAGKAHLRHSGYPVDDYTGGKLPTSQVLVVGPGSNDIKPAQVAPFLKAGGHVLALGLNEAEAASALPFKVGMKPAEHIAAHFEPGGMQSLWAGIAPADVHNRAPRELPLVTEPAIAVGDGVLGKAREANVVFWQLPPYTLTAAEGAVAGWVVDDQEAAEGQRSARVTLGTTCLAQFGQAVKLKAEIGKTYTLAAQIKPLGRPLVAHLEVERAGSPWDRAVKGPDVTLPADQWTDLRVTFTCDKDYPEGWQAYVGSNHDGGRFRVDAFRLYEGEYVPWKAGEGPPNLMTNAGFEEGDKPWFFTHHEQYNLRRTYRRASFTLTRLLGNMGVSPATPLLARFGSPVAADKAEKRWLDGYYVDEPEEWDDPYRAFRW